MQKSYFKKCFSSSIYLIL